MATYRPGYRPRWLDKSYATQLALQRLTPRDSLQVVQAVLHDKRVTEALAQELLARADGNPFFLEELARIVVEQGDRRLSLTVPETIHAVLAAHIDRLPLEGKRLLQAAAPAPQPPAPQAPPQGAMVAPPVAAPVEIARETQVLPQPAIVMPK